MIGTNGRGTPQTASFERLAIFASAVSLLALASVDARAQDISDAPPPAPTPAAAEPTAESGVQEIVVTARKRIESSQDIPVSVTALSGEQVDRFDLTNLERVAAATPQFSVGRASNGSGAQLTLRGIGSSSTSIGLEQSVAVVVDGVYYGQGRIINEGFFDLGRIEILKGPQALFFGKNATAGVISITTADPGDELEAQARVGFEFGAEELLGEAIVSSPVSETLGVRVSLRGSKMFDGYYKNLAGPVSFTTTDIATGAQQTFVAPPAAADEPGQEELLGRVTVRWEPTDQFDATLKLSGTKNRTNNNSWNYVIYRCPTGASQLNPSIRCEGDHNVYQNDLPEEIASDYPVAKDGDLYNKYRSWAITGTMNYDLGDIAFTSVTNYNWNRNNWLCHCDFQSAPNFTFASENSKWHAFSTEFRAVTSYDGPVNLLAGIYYQKTKRDFNQWVAFLGLANSAAPPGNRYVASQKNSETEGETIAGFGQVLWNFLPGVEAAAGVRYTHETKDSYFIQPYANPAVTAVFVPGVRVDADQTFNNWSPEATLTWQANDDITIYGAYKTAYKSGGFSNSGILGAVTVPEDFTFEPEKAKGFEGGIKTRLLGNQLRLDLIAYDYKFTNLQVDFFNSPTFAFITTNAGSAKTTGVELEATYAPEAVEGLTLQATVNYNKARYGSFIAPCYTGQTPAQGCTIVGPPPGLTPLQDLTGVETALAPRWTASLGVNYEAPIGGFVLGLAANARYSDDYLPSSFGNPFSRIDEYVNLDASVRVRTEDERWEVALIGKNLTNRFYVTGVVDGPSTGSGTGTPGGVLADQVGFGNIPRTVQLQLTWRY